MKAIILAAGEGKRMRPLTLETPKPMIEVLGRPLLHHIIDSLPAEITELVLVIGYRGEQIQKYFGAKFEGRPVTYVVQEKALGTGHALHLCKHLIKPGEKFLFMFADDLHSPTALEKLVHGGLGVLAQEHLDPKPFGVLEVDASGRIIGIEEKPKQPKSNLVAVGVYVFDNTFFDYPMPLSARGEYEYIEPFQAMIKKLPVLIEKTDFWHPIGHPHDIVSAEGVLRARHGKAVDRKTIPVILLAGGKGTRMPENEKHKPKVLVEIAGKPMLQWQIEQLYQQGFFNIILSLGYKSEMVIDWLHESGHQNIGYVIETEPLGTGGGIKLAAAGIREPFLAFNADDISDVDLASLVRHGQSGRYNVVTGMEIADARAYGLIECDEYKKICKFREKDPTAMRGTVNIGRYYLLPDVFDGTPKAFSIEHDIFPKLAAAGKLVLHRHTGNYWFGCGTPETLAATREYFSKMHK